MFYYHVLTDVSINCIVLPTANRQRYIMISNAINWCSLCVNFVLGHWSTVNI